jgi:hypothetical protein
MHIAISNTLTCSVIRLPSGMLGIKSLKNMKRNLSPSSRPLAPPLHLPESVLGAQLIIHARRS